LGLKYLNSLRRIRDLGWIWIKAGKIVPHKRKNLKFYVEELLFGWAEGFMEPERLLFKKTYITVFDQKSVYYTFF
jgi:hypothetical protein